LSAPVESAVEPAAAVVESLVKNIYEEAVSKIVNE
jgi:hypothetical protein